MRHLYIIGNGFDLFTGLHTRYSDFRKWLEHNYPFVYENMRSAYEMNGEWWNDFEEQLGNLDVANFVKKFHEPLLSIEDFMKRINPSDSNERCQNTEYGREANIMPSLHKESKCAKRLRGLFDILQFCFEKWVGDCQECIINPKITKIETEDSYFINFNYTDVLQSLYKIPDERVLHIHGRASKHEHLIFGHDSTPYYPNKLSTYDIEETCFELSRYRKYPYEHIYKHENLTNILKDCSYIHVYGFSISPIDEEYLDWIEKNAPKNSEWEFSWHTEIDKTRIYNFVKSHPAIGNRYTLIKLEVSR